MAFRWLTPDSARTWSRSRTPHCSRDVHRQVWNTICQSVVNTFKSKETKKQTSFLLHVTQRRSWGGVRQALCKTLFSLSHISTLTITIALALKRCCRETPACTTSKLTEGNQQLDIPVKVHFSFNQDCIPGSKL